MPALPFIAAAASVGGALISANGQRSAANTAAQAQADNTAANNALALDMYNRNEARLNPFISGGLNAFNAQQNLLGLGSDPAAQQAAFDTWRNSTGYQFGMDQALGQVGAYNAAQNVRLSGGAQKALQDRAGQVANSGFGNYYNMLGGLASTGYGAASAAGGIGQGYVTQVSNNNQNAADARSNAALYNGQVNSNLYNGIGQLAGNLFGQSSYGNNASPWPSTTAPWSGFNQGVGTGVWG